MNKIALVTGATSGIGRSISFELAKESYNLIITGRREDRLIELKREIEDLHSIKVKILSFDVRSLAEVTVAINSLSDEWKEVDILVNNAGLAVGLNTIQEGVIDDWERMIDTNIKGLLYITRAISPIMCERGSGHIINIASIAGKEVYANGNVYCATKHAVDALSRSMRIDMVKYGVKVTNIAPGAVETEFSLVRFKDDAERAQGVYKGYQPLSADDIANIVRFVVTLPPHVSINDLVVTCTAQANATTIVRGEELIEN